MSEFIITDNTDLEFFQAGEGESFKARASAVLNNLVRRVEALGSSVATSRSAHTEQGRRFTAFANGYVKPEGGVITPKIVAGDMGADAQITAIQAAAGELFETILANKPVLTSILIWRTEPELGRSLCPDGLHIWIYCRLAWEDSNG